MPPFNGVPYCRGKANILIDKGKPRFNQPFGIILRIGGAFDGGQKNTARNSAAAMVCGGVDFCKAYRKRGISRC